MASPERISELDAKATIADTDLFVLMDEEATPDQTKYITGANLKAQFLASLVEKIDKTHLSQDFGASSARLQNLIMTPIAGEALRMQPATSPSIFLAVINGNPTATSVVYWFDSNEGSIGGIVAGASRWGRVVLHNITRGNSRKIVSVNTGTSTITTESSTDDWADTDSITCQSQTNTQGGYFDLDLSAEVAATTTTCAFFVTVGDGENNYDASRYFIMHPYEAYDAGKRQYLHCAVAQEASSLSFLMNINSQKVTAFLGTGVVDVTLTISVKGEYENADT